MLIVQKYGGASVATTERIINIAKKVIENHNRGDQVVVVLSAKGDTTDDLINMAKEIDENVSKRELDMLISTGEQQSASFLAMAIQKFGVQSISLNSYQAGILTDSNHSNSRIESINTERILRELEKNQIVIITGFQGIDAENNITTLGRGGSDTTAVALAAALGAEVCEIYTDVDGVYTADPRLISGASKLESINYNNMLELSSQGAKVLHNRSVSLAQKYNVKLVIRSSFNNNEGTFVDNSSFEKQDISGVALNSSIAVIFVKGSLRFSRLISVLSFGKIAFDMVSFLNDGEQSNIGFVITKESLKEVMQILDEYKAEINATEIYAHEDVCKISIVGTGITSNRAIVSKLFQALRDISVIPICISCSEIALSLIVDNNQASFIANHIHERIFTE